MARYNPADKYLRKLPILMTTVLPASMFESMVVRRNGPAALIHPNALIGGLGGGTIGSLGTYGISRWMGSDTPKFNAYLGGLAGTALGHALGAASVR